MKTRALLLLLSIPMSSAALADDLELRRCRGIADASARLACYDAMVLPVSQGEVNPAKPTLPSEHFGFEQQAIQSGPQTIDSYIPGRFEGWDSNARIRLANGQVWQITDGSKRAFNLTDPKVSVRRGIFGAFFLDIEGYNFAPKVKRVQ